MSERKFIFSLFILAFIGFLFIGYGHFIEQKTIESARLVKVTKSGYYIAFGENVHSYTFD